ncbi:phage tail protein I [Klebsiella pneumoniae]|uniref:phage tail protein I n=1 Tax=Klebsiella pneumoniae TaxID=573 RepID=UPI00124BA24F|nr:phage tail protein I [Klebsiella pneumoniae]KAB1774871.1 phage tail protein I [Klebsiella pneumoniae]MBV7341681.1 phage tail protein I [Klebsiella pneumoniae]HDO7096589.1 phage tail protein I [Klebsiella pneumoniae]
MSNSLLPPSSGGWMRSAEASSGRLSGIAVAIRQVWTPEDCPVELLPYLAWALSVDRWDKDWPAEKKIAAIQQSYWLHRRKGTRAAVRRVIEGMGFSATFAEWFDVGDEPGTFRLEVDVSDVGIAPRTLDELDRMVDGTKPASRHMAQMTLANRTQGAAFTGAAVFDGDEVSVYPPDYEPDSGIFYNGVFPYEGDVDFIGE